MPQIVERLVSQLKSRGMGESKARATAHNVLRKAGNINADGSLTIKGKKRQAKGAEWRAKDRAAKRSKTKRNPADYNYSKRTNRATLKKAGDQRGKNRM